MTPRYPIYIVSKGRADSRLTSKALHQMGVPHYIVVERQELETYAAVIDSTATLLELDPAYQRDYDPCDQLGDTKGKGPGPARNFAWDHSISLGAERHWVLDDNIREFLRLIHNRQIRTHDVVVFRVMEDFVDRYSNVAMAGPQYKMFSPRRLRLPPFVMNTRIYSCNLIRNDLPYRWRGHYNEDTDLSLRMLKDGWVTIEFYVFLQHKMMTQAMKGGNTAEFYAAEGTLPKSKMLVELHPDVTRLVKKYGRWHHSVDYSRFDKNRLRRRPGVEIPEGINEYGMTFQKRDPVTGEWVTQ